MINEKQERTIEEIRQYIIEHELNTVPDGIITKFDVKTSELQPSRKLGIPRTLVQLFITTDTKNAVNPFLEDSYHVVITYQGGIRKVVKRYFGGRERNITNHVLRILGRSRR